MPSTRAPAGVGQLPSVRPPKAPDAEPDLEAPLAIADKAGLDIGDQGLVLACLRGIHERHGPACKEAEAFALAASLKDAGFAASAPAKKEPVRKSQDVVLWGLVFCAVFVMALLANLAGNYVSQPVVASKTGALLTPSDVPVGTGEYVTTHALRDYPNLDPSELQKVRDCALQHRGVLHVWQVASVRKYNDLHVELSAADGSHIAVWRSGEIRFQLPFETEQVIEPSEKQPADLKGRFGVVTSDDMTVSTVQR